MAVRPERIQVFRADEPTRVSEHRPRGGQGGDLPRRHHGIADRARIGRNRHGAHADGGGNGGGDHPGEPVTARLAVGGEPRARCVRPRAKINHLLQGETMHASGHQLRHHARAVSESGAASLAGAAAVGLGRRMRKPRTTRSSAPGAATTRTCSRPTSSSRCSSRKGVTVQWDVAAQDPRKNKLIAERRLPSGTLDIACLCDVDMYRHLAVGRARDHRRVEDAELEERGRDAAQALLGAAHLFGHGLGP